MSIAAIDYESEYSKKGLSASTVGVHNYARRTNVYLVSIVTDDGFEWVGHPSEAPWEKVLGHTWISHNRSFDMTVHRALKFPEPKDWHCTADMASYCQLPRALAKATNAVYGEVVDKSVRDKMDGVKWADLGETEQEEVRQYALKDGRACLRLWTDFQSKWPESERWLSRHTTEMGHRGIGLDVPMLHSGIEILRQKLHQIRKDIPWEGPPTSPKELARACRDAGLEPPISTSIKDSRYDAWLKENEEKVPWVRSLGLYRSTNRLLSGLETMDAFRDGDNLHQCLLYCGAPHTGRWSGGTGGEGSGLNLQNLLKKPLWEVDQRATLVARPGHTFLTADLSQIEPRCCRAGTLVLTDSGYKPIEELTTIDKVYDGVQWCRHDGIVKRPARASVDVNGEAFTEDHLLWAGGIWRKAGEVVDEEGAPHQVWEERGAGWADVWKLARFVGAYLGSVLCSVLAMRIGVPERSSGRPAERQ